MQKIKASTLPWLCYNYFNMTNESIFRSYDVRGIYPSELNEDIAFNIGRAFIKFSGARKIAVGQDARLASPALFKAFVAGVSHEGGQIHDIGKVLTECVYFAVGFYDFDAGVMITASHNPKEYDGFKMIKKNGNNIEMIRGVDIQQTFESLASAKQVGQRQEIEKKDIWKDFLNHVLDFVDLSEIAPLKVVVDASNGVGGLAIEKIKDKLPIEIIPINFELDGNFPAHGPNPLIEGTVKQIAEEITKNKADFGFMFDGDADRIFLVDENGKMVYGDTTLLLLAKYFLEKNPGMAVAYNLICSKATPVFIKKYGGVPIKTKVGFVNVREGLQKNNGILGGEMSGHYCFKDNYYMDSGMIAFLELLRFFSKDQRRVSEIIKEMAPYSKTDANFQVGDKEKTLNTIKEKYSDGKQDFTDGITVEYEDWWFNVRPSNNEPLIRLTIEADTKELLDKKLKDLTKIISK